MYGVNGDNNSLAMKGPYVEYVRDMFMESKLGISSDESYVDF